MGECEQASAILDELDAFEARILEFDTRLSKGEDCRPLVHTLFRNAHNIKGALGVAGLDAAVALVHAAESCLDALRSSDTQPEATLPDLLVAVVDALRREVSGEGSPAYADLPRELANEENRIRQARPVARGIDFALAAGELAALESCALRGEPLWLVEKLVEAALPEEALDGLPIFATVAEIGELVARRIKRAESGGDAVLMILFAAKVGAEELGFHIFDPFFPVAAKAAESGPAAGADGGAMAPTAGSGGLPRVLIVDDEALALLLLQKALVDYGRIDAVSSGAEALERFGQALASTPYSVVFLDILLEDMKGTEVLVEMRRREKEAGLPDGHGARIVMSSSLGDFGTVSEAFRAQCEAYLVKPVDPSKIREAMAKMGFPPVG